MRAGAKITINDVGVPDTVAGPIKRGQRFGYREVLADGKRIAAVPIVVVVVGARGRPAAADQGLVHAAARAAARRRACWAVPCWWRAACAADRRGAAPRRSEPEAA